MNDNKTARKKLEQMEKARKMEEERRERIKAQRNRGVDTSERKSPNCDIKFHFFSNNIFCNGSIRNIIANRRRQEHHG